MRKAQISQVFTYLMAILVVGLIVFVGYKGVAWILNTNCEHGKAAFQKELFQLIDDYSDRGSTRVEMLSAPCDVTKVCFADLSHCENPEQNIPDFEPFIRSSLDEKYRGVVISSVYDCDNIYANIFIVGKTTEPLGYAPKLVLKQDVGNSDYPFKCFEVRSGKIRFLFRGLGRKTQLEEARPG
ncbi:hypothetical protein JXB28_03185 [Candidatus Woesearchaeota archaeon]|nr:hypothetical protein [Candidatus Woesearchaeota archaeon]